MVRFFEKIFNANLRKQPKSAAGKGSLPEHSYTVVLKTSKHLNDKHFLCVVLVNKNPKRTYGRTNVLSHAVKIS